MGPKNPQRQKAVTWGQIAIAAVAAALAIHFAWYSYERAQARKRTVIVVPVDQRAVPASSQRRPRPRTAEPDELGYQLQPGERCLNGKFVYQVTVNHWADAPAQDWKCRPSSRQ